MPFGLSGKRLSMDRRIAANRHNNGANLVYFDGHAGFLAGNKITIDLFRENKP